MSDIFSHHDEFDAISISIASPEKILQWSHGEVKKPETINYRTQKPERDGLFCEKIFGPTKNWECYCGKYKKIKYRGVVCEKCNVEVTRKVVRRERMGHIKLAAPVTHTWFLRSVPSKIGLLLNISSKTLEQVISFAAYIVKEVRDEERQAELTKMESEWKKLDLEIKENYRQKQQKIEVKKRDAKKGEKEAMQEETAVLTEKSAKRVDELKDQFIDLRRSLEGLHTLQILSEAEYVKLRQHFGHVFEAGIGAEALQEIIASMDLEKILASLKDDLKNQSGQKFQKTLKRIKLIGSFIKNSVKPEWMILTVLPVLPPDLRPMVPLDGGRFATSDLNDLYRRVINRNNRLKRLIQIGAPEVITRNEKRMLQEAVDSVINNAPRGGRVAYNAGDKRRYKSLTDILKGKQGRFRQNLLGKRVDYSGRSVIVVNPYLKMNQCGLPKKMALELFRPFVLGRIIRDGLAANLKQAEKLFERRTKEVWDLLNEVAQGHAVLLNRAPTLHRLGIQAFVPILVDGHAIQIHPLACEAYNADFDGDQMAVHLPLSKEAQAEAYEIMMSNHNLLKPASAEPITVPRQDMVLGLYYMTSVNEKKKGAGSIFGSQEEAKIANNLGHVHQLAPIKVRMDGQLIETTVGRLKFNDILPLELRFLNETVSKKVIKRLFMEIIEKCGRERLVKFTDDAKYLGFENATVSGLSMGIIGINPPAKKAKVLEQANEQVEQLNKHYRYGLLTEEERYENTLKVWGKAKAEIAEATKSAIPKDNSIYLMIDSGSRGNWDNITHLLGMKGSVASPTGKIIELPIRSSILEGFSIIEYFIGCHAGRKGMADRSLRTAQAGYLTRKLVDSVQDVLIREDDCGTEKSINISKADSTKMKMNYAERLFSRRAAEDIADENGEVLVPKGEIINREMARKIDALGIGEARIFAPTTCQTKNGVCKKCYGLDLATASEVNCGTPVGIMAAQSIGEPGTQLTMNTFHLHGAAESADITAGLPRVEELFEARSPKVEAFMSPVAGIVSIKPREYGLLIILRPNEAIEDKYDLHRETRVLVKTNDKVTAKQIIGKTELGENKFTIKAKAAGKVVEITPEYITIRRPEDEVFEYKIGSRVKILVKDGDKIAAGTQLTAGHLDLRKLLAATDIQSVQNYIVSETQKVYASQGVSIHDKHFEIVTNQMLSRVRITDGGDTDYLPGEVISRRQIEIENAELERQNKKKASYEQLILGIARVALNTDSWLSAAAFQETVKVLIEAASASDVDDLDGVKENVIIGRLIPAGKNFKPKTPCHNVEAKLV